MKNGSQPLAIAALLDLIKERSGLDLLSTMRDRAMSCIQNAMQQLGIRDARQYEQLLLQRPSLFDELIDALIVSETYFFREPAQFQFITDHIIPALRDQRREGHVFRAWSAGCATGEEAFSLAAVLTSAGLEEYAEILATDISKAVLARANTGLCALWSMRGEIPPPLRPYLTRLRQGWQVAPALRHLIDFKPLNLISDPFPDIATNTCDLDLILCRNVMIYFDAAVVEQLAHRLYDCLAPGGWLITASSDPPLFIEDRFGFETIVSEVGIFYRRPLVPTVEKRSNVSFVSTTSSDDDKSKDINPTIRIKTPLPGTIEAVRLLLIAGGPENLAKAAQLTRDAVEKRPLSAEWHYLQATILLEQGHDHEAIDTLKRVLYLDHNLASAHFILGRALRRRGDKARALRAFRNALDLCQSASEFDEFTEDTYRPNAMTNGMHLRRMAALATIEMDLLRSDEEKNSSP